MNVYTIEVFLQDLGISGSATIKVVAASRKNAERAARDTFNAEHLQLNVISEDKATR